MIRIFHVSAAARKNCLSTSAPELHNHVAGTLSNQQATTTYLTNASALLEKQKASPTALHSTRLCYDFPTLPIAVLADSLLPSLLPQSSVSTSSSMAGLFQSRVWQVTYLRRFPWNVLPSFFDKKKLYSPVYEQGAVFCSKSISIKLQTYSLCVCLVATWHPSNVLVYPGDGSAQTRVGTATLRQGADQTCYLIQTQFTYTELTTPSTDPVTPGNWQGRQWSTKGEKTHMKSTIRSRNSRC